MDIPEYITFFSSNIWTTSERCLVCVFLCLWSGEWNRVGPQGRANGNKKPGQKALKWNYKAQGASHGLCVYMYVCFIRALVYVSWERGKFKYRVNERGSHQYHPNPSEKHYPHTNTQIHTHFLQGPNPTKWCNWKLIACTPKVVRHLPHTVCSEHKHALNL